MTIKPSLFFISLIFFFSGCLLSIPDASRINENDPESPLFNPKISNLNSFISPSEKEISLNWNNESSFNDGFFIEKRFSTKSKYTKIDTLEASFFSEALNEYGIDMQYRITSFYIENGSFKKGMELETESLDFGRISNIGYFSSNDTVFVQWFRRTAFDDITTVEYKLTSSSDWNTAITIEQDEMESDFFRTNFILPTGKSYNLRVIVSLSNQNENLENFYITPTFTISHN